MKDALEHFFFRIMGISGWLYLLLLVVSGVAYSPYNKNHELLFFEWFLALLIWWCSRVIGR